VKNLCLLPDCSSYLTEVLCLLTELLNVKIRQFELNWNILKSGSVFSHLFILFLCIIEVSDRDSVSVDTQNQMTLTPHRGQKNLMDIPNKRAPMSQIIIV